MAPSSSQALCSVFQLQVSSLLSNVFKLLMTHKVRPGRGARALVRQEGGLWGRQVASGLWQVFLLQKISFRNVLTLIPLLRVLFLLPDVQQGFPLITL